MAATVEKFIRIFEIHPQTLMIFYLVTTEHSYTIDLYLRTWPKSRELSITTWFYDYLFKAKRFPFGVYIFSDLERLSPEQTRAGLEVREKLKDVGAVVLNHPSRSRRRYELLRTLYERGVNEFNVYRLTECRMPQRFPVFIREENEHTGSLTLLLNTPKELELAIHQLVNQGQSPKDKLVVEFCNTVDALGIFRKYSVMVIGSKIIPRHILFSKNWLVKFPQPTTEAMRLEEKNYIETNPHAEQLREIFQATRIEYGRVDYALSNGKIQVWEINTNPMLLTPDWQSHSERLWLSKYFLQQFDSAFTALL